MMLAGVFGQALQEFDMIRDGDRVMVCLSGGKDSLSLLHTLHQYQFYAKSKGVHYTLGAATVDPGSSAYDPRPLVPYLKALGVHYLYEEQGGYSMSTRVARKQFA
jgi:tRNA(Ile)-lysidine synthase TilS/MesJ